MLDIKVLTFLTVCEEMNFTKAAKKLHITQPAVSMHIRNLEEYYGVPLFSFEGKHFSLTEYGSLIHDSLLSMQNNDKYLRERLTALAEKKEIINMGATITVGEFMLSDSISEYLNRHENADVSIVLSNTRSLLEKLDHGEIDFAVLEGDFPKSRYAHKTLYFADFTAVCAKDLPLSGNILSVSALSQYRLLIREPGSGTRKILEDALEEESLSLSHFSRITTIGSMNAIIDLVKNGCGITFLYKSAVKNLLKSGELKEIPLAEFPIQHEISIVWCKDTIQDEKLKELIMDLFSV